MTAPRPADLTRPPRWRVRPMRRARGIRIGFIPDLQVAPGVPTDHLDWIGAWVKDRRPDVLVQGGDWGEMGSCSSYEKAGTLSAEGRSTRADLRAVRDSAMRLDAAMSGWRPRKVVTLGNHEVRLDRYVDAHPEERDSYADDPFGLEALGWEVHPFLSPVEINGVWFSHFFPRSGTGRVMQTKAGAPNALTMVKREMRSCVAGHTQGLDVACLTVGGRTLRGVIAGSCYLHELDFLSPQGNSHWAGVLEMNEVHDGHFDLVEVSLDYLCRRYGRGRWPR